jgi:hypothetical protein
MRCCIRILIFAEETGADGGFKNPHYVKMTGMDFPLVLAR